MPKQKNAVKNDIQKMHYVDVKNNTNKEKTYQKKNDKNINESEKIE